jgi:hypothetical protein
MNVSILLNNLSGAVVMKFSILLRRSLFPTLIAAALSCAIAWGFARQGEVGFGPAVNGLQISISRVNGLVKTKGLGVLQINLYNSGKKDLYTIPGMLQDACAERRNLAGNFKLTMTDSNGVVLRLVPPLWIICEGNMEPFTLPLPAGTTFSIPIDLNRYSYGGADGTGLPANLSTKLKPGEFSIQAEFTGTDVGQYDDLRTEAQMREDQAKQRVIRLPIWATMDAWHGTVKSNRLRVSYGSEDSSNK